MSAGEPSAGFTLMPRLNPFAFPSDTDFRLLLLIAAIVASGLFIYNWVYFALPQTRADLPAYRQCQAHAVANGGSDATKVEQSFDSCRAPIEQRKAAWMLGGVALILVAGFAIYAVTPVVMLRRRRLVPLSIQDVPDIIPVIEDLSRQAGLRSPPVFVWNPLNGAPVGIAFGRVGRHYVAVTGGLVTRFYSDRAAFDAVVLHELGHLRNGDVDKTYLALSLWQAFVLLGLVPLSGTLISAPSVADAAQEGWILAWRIVALTALVYLVRNAVLRSRETYADLRAAQSEGSTQTMDRVLGATHEETRSGLGRWRDTFALHPSRAARRQALRDTRPLFRVGVGEAIATGLAAGIAYPIVVSLIELILTGVPTDVRSWTSGEFGGALVSAMLSLLVAGVVGVGLWRATFAAVIEGGRTASVPAISVALGAGLIVGGWVGFDGGFALLPADRISLVVFFGVLVPVVAVLIGGLALILWWFVVTSRRSLQTALAAGSQPHWLLSFLGIAAVLAVWLTVTLQARDMLEIAAGSGLPAWTYPLFATAPFVQALWNPIGLFGVACVLGLSLFAAAGRSGAVPLPAWAFLDPAPSGYVAAPPKPDLGRVLLFALAGGAAYALLVTGMRLALGSTATWDISHILLLFAAEVALAVLVQVGVVVAISVRTSTLQVLPAIAGATLSGGQMAIEAFWVNVALGGKPDPNGAWALLAVTVFAGLVFVTPAALLSGLLRRRARRTQDGQRP